MNYNQKLINKLIDLIINVHHQYSKEEIMMAINIVTLDMESYLYKIHLNSYKILYY